MTPRPEHWSYSAQSRATLDMIKPIEELRLMLGQLTLETFLYVDQFLRDFLAFITRLSTLGALGRRHHIPCLNDPVFSSLNEDERIFLDGKAEGIISVINVVTW